MFLLCDDKRLILLTLLRVSLLLSVAAARHQRLPGVARRRSLVHFALFTDVAEEFVAREVLNFDHVGLV